MNYHNYLCCILLLIGSSVFAQQGPAIEWQKTLGGVARDEAYSIQQTVDGGYIVAGWTDSNDGDLSGNNGNSDFWVVKLDDSGNLSWQKTLGGSANDQATSIQQTFDGGYIVTGWTLSNDGDVSGKNGSNDFWVVKLNGSGDLSWQKTLGGSAFDQATSIQQTADGGYIVAGGTDSNDGDVSGNNGDIDFWVVKLDDSGNLSWQRALGGAIWDIARSIQQTADGGYIVTGSTFDQSDMNDNGGSYLDFWVVKLDGSGRMKWEKALGGFTFDEAHSIQQTFDGGYIVTGWTYSNDGDVSGNNGANDFWVVKLNGSGDLVWQKALGGSADDEAYSIQQTADGGYIVGGLATSNNGDVSGNHGGWDFWVVKLNGSGDLIWQKALGGSAYDKATSIQQTADGGYIVAGWTDSNDGDISGNHGDRDF